MTIEIQPAYRTVKTKHEDEHHRTLLFESGDGFMWVATAPTWAAEQIEALQKRAALADLGVAVHAMALEKGWWDAPLEERVPRLLEWIKEEADEALEAFSAHGFDAWTSTDADGLEKPEGFGSELYDVLGITLDLAIGTGIDLVEHGALKHAYNKVRRYKRDASGATNGGAA